MKMLWDKEPDYINEEGVKWWLDNIITNHLHREDRNGISLKNMYGYLIEFPDSIKTYVIVNNDSGEVIYESQQLESIGCHVDVLKFLKRNPD